MPIYHRLVWMLIVSFLFFGTLGCGNSRLGSLNATVMIDGQPAPAGIPVSFSPVSGKSPSYGETDENGRLEAAYTHRRKGIEIGEHRVQLMPGGNSRNAGKMPEPGEKFQEPPKLPQRYFDEIMTITVKPGKNEIEIPLESK